MKNLPCENNCAYLITDKIMRKYFSGIDVEEGYLLIDDNYTCFTDARYFSAVKEVLENANINAVLFKGLESIKSIIDEKNIKKLYVDYDVVTLSEYNSLKELCVDIKDCSETLKKVRSIKTEEELSYIKNACSIAEKAYHLAIKEVKKGITEKWLKERLEHIMLSLGAEETSFETIVAFGKNAAVPHHKTDETILEENNVVLVDMGCKVNGYCSDITRTAFFGQPNKKFLDCYKAVLEANITAEENITNGTNTSDADGFARNKLKERGLAEYFTHSLGHGVGLLIHEYPTLSPKKKDALKDGMVFTIEPGVYIDGEFGIRIEDTVMLKGGKVERLFTDSKELIIL